MKKMILAACASASLLLVACGGGGDDPAPPQQAAAPAPATTPVATPAAVTCPDSYSKISGKIQNVTTTIYAGDKPGNNFAQLTLKTPADATADLKICLGKLTSLPAGTVGDVAYEIRGTKEFDTSTNRQLVVTVPTTGTIASNPTVRFYTLSDDGKATASALTAAPTFDIVSGKVVVTVPLGQRGLYTVKLP